MLSMCTNLWTLLLSRFRSRTLLTVTVSACSVLVTLCDPLASMTPPSCVLSGMDLCMTSFPCLTNVSISSDADWATLKWCLILRGKTLCLERCVRKATTLTPLLSRSLILTGCAIARHWPTMPRSDWTVMSGGPYVFWLYVLANVGPIEVALLPRTLPMEYKTICRIHNSRTRNT